MFGADQGTWATAAALLGGTLAATSHTAKTATRAAVNTSPEPFSNIFLSLIGDAAVPGMLWLATTHPVAAIALLVFATLAMLAIIVLLMKVLRGLWARFRGREPEAGEAA